MKVLGIETSCDETAVAIVSSNKEILSHRILSQIDDHAEYGGVVPEIAARQHIQHLDTLIEGALADANLDVSDLDAIAATTGPGLVGGLMVGVMTAKAMALAAGKPFISVNHLEGHALTARLVEEISFPYLLLLVSGGHCQILMVKGVGDYERLGSTIDDAAGEAFDKTAKLLNLGYPGGPAIEKLAQTGDPLRFKLPKPLVNKPGCDFSFSGLKTAVRRAAEDCIRDNGAITPTDQADLSASFQKTVGDCLSARLDNAIDMFKGRVPEGDYPFVVAGGVAANKYLRGQLQDLVESRGFSFYAAPLNLCTDNGAMIAWAGMERFMLDPAINDIEVSPRPRWPLDSFADPMGGSGKKGAKA
ncbi:tRNA (adenosine(37)-N6)-threonylcarbamoyltransferase complex transferase subunit TsaD [Kordiimonas sp. SCSIO 12610]|uniref:tRNA (adenosine(37)-N6)-threonylcarbamoyltransferase complex transferase subunit TsaD n=1 Tax=Kordiimonas sp. SCSIO 12610 TaxID=2829597 RepID=UPI00351F6A9A